MIGRYPLPPFLVKFSRKIKSEFLLHRDRWVPPTFSSKILEKIGRYPLPLTPNYIRLIYLPFKKIEVVGIPKQFLASALLRFFFQKILAP